MSQSYLGLGVYSGAVVDQDLSDVDFVLLGSQVEWSQARLRDIRR